MLIALLTRKKNKTRNRRLRAGVEHAICPPLPPWIRILKDCTESGTRFYKIRHFRVFGIGWCLYGFRRGEGGAGDILGAEKLFYKRLVFYVYETT